MIVSPRVDPASVTASVLALPAKFKQGLGVGFCCGEPVAQLLRPTTLGPPCRWRAGKPELLAHAAKGSKGFDARSAAADRIVGTWHDKEWRHRALVWTAGADGALASIELHPAGWHSTVALASGDGQIVGSGSRQAGTSSAALLWHPGAQLPILLHGPDPTATAEAVGVAGGVQVGHHGGPGRQRACLWRGSTETRVDLDGRWSQARAAGDGQQAGVVWPDSDHGRATLWAGEPGSAIDLTPKGFEHADVNACASGLQAGWAAAKPRAAERAMLWRGTPEPLDLQGFVPAPFNASIARAFEIREDRIFIIGCARELTFDASGTRFAGAEVPVLWTGRLV